uniref:DNA repair protein XRCC4 n=2 Tax=Lygus hesperus TaxID=30085 RepID=A0A0A9YGW1_LYGHE
MSSELTIVTIIDSSSGKVLKLQGKWTGNDVQLLINDGASSWTGRFNLDEVEEETLSQLELERNQYLERMKSALGTTTVNSKYRYTFEDDSLMWAKIVTPDFSVLHGRITFRPVAASSHGELVRSLLDSYGSVLEELSESVARYNRLEREYQEINSSFEDCCRIKTEMESTLYTKFAMILNEKKEYVRRVTGEYPTENFGPKPSSDTKSCSSRDITTVSWEDFSKVVKRDASASGERPSKKLMLEPQASTSRDSLDDDMDM